MHGEAPAVMTFQAIYEHGFLRPLEPLGLAEGELVNLTVAEKPIDPATEAAQRIQASQTIQEWVEATKMLPPDDGGYDIVRALEENRIWSGERARCSASNEGDAS